MAKAAMHLLAVLCVVGALAAAPRASAQTSSSSCTITDTYRDTVHEPDGSFAALTIVFWDCNGETYAVVTIQYYPATSTSHWTQTTYQHDGTEWQQKESRSGSYEEEVDPLKTPATTADNECTVCGKWAE